MFENVVLKAHFNSIKLESFVIRLGSEWWTSWSRWCFCDVSSRLTNFLHRFAFPRIKSGVSHAWIKSATQDTYLSLLPLRSFRGINPTFVARWNFRIRRARSWSPPKRWRRRLIMRQKCHPLLKFKWCLRWFLSQFLSFIPPIKSWWYIWDLIQVCLGLEQSHPHTHRPRNNIRSGKSLPVFPARNISPLLSFISLNLMFHQTSFTTVK